MSPHLRADAVQLAHTSLSPHPILTAQTNPTPPIRWTGRRSVPAGVLDGVRALLNIDVDLDADSPDGGEEEEKEDDTRGAGRRRRRRRLLGPADGETANQHGDGEETLATVDANRAERNFALLPPSSEQQQQQKQQGNDARRGSDVVAGTTLPDGTTDTQGLHHALATDGGGGGCTDGEDDSDDDGGSGTDDGSDPWGDGRGESRWGQWPPRVGTAGARGTDRDTGSGTGGSDEHAGLALVRALGSWCASVSAYDRLAHLPPGSAARRAAEAETEWDELERRIARSRLDVQLEEFRCARLRAAGGGARNIDCCSVRLSVVGMYLSLRRNAGPRSVGATGEPRGETSHAREDGA